jgi:hypothetical protein
MTKLGLTGRGLLLGGWLAACSNDPATRTSCELANPEASCSGGAVCEEVGGAPACVAPVLIEGRVIDALGAPVSGALVTALDGNDAPATGTATSGGDGRYRLRVPVARTTAGALTVRAVRLRAAAAGFETFPTGLRRSLPIELSAAALPGAGGALVVTSPATEIALSALPGAAAWGSIAGVVGGGAGARGVLVVAEGPGGVASAISDRDGAYVIFNVVPGTYTVRGYAAGIQLEARATVVSPSARTSGVDLAPRAVETGTVSGSVNIVDAPGGSMTSVVLVVASTFNEALKRGEVPPGLRAPSPSAAPSVNGPFSIAGVPDGDYFALAAFENDNLVRDPDTAIGGTAIQRVTVGEGTRQVALPASFKVTEALTIEAPGGGDAPDLVSGAPTFVWRDDSSEERYALELIDAQGNVVWRDDQVPKQTGGSVKVLYGGPALPPAALFQFRVTSFRKGDVPISQSEELRGVFQTR